MTQPRVFIPQLALRKRVIQGQEELVPSVDITPSAEYGVPTIIYRAGFVELNSLDALIDGAERIKSITEQDYILPIGSPLLISTVVALALQHVKVVNYLWWSKNDQRYTVIPYDYTKFINS